MSQLPHILILAAGVGSRFRAAGGGDKLQASLAAPGELGVLQTTLRTWRSLGVPCTAVVSAQASWRAEMATAEGVAVVSVASQGMGESLAAGVRATRESAGWLIALGDMPFVNAQSGCLVLAQAHPERIVVPVWAGRRGHPVLFGRTFAERLLALDGDEGAKRLLRQGPVLEVEVDDPGIHRDVDIPADLRRG